MLYKGPIIGPDVTAAVAASIEREKADLLTRVSIKSRKRETVIATPFLFVVIATTEECTSVTGYVARAIPFDVEISEGHKDDATTW